MLYSYSCKFTKEHTEATKEKYVLKLASGVINGIDIYFPQGCCGLVFVHVNDGLHQIVPVNPDSQLTGSGNLIRFSEDILFDSEPYELQFYGWNVDTEYDHTIDIKIELHKQSSLLRYIMKSLASLIIFEKE